MITATIGNTNVTVIENSLRLGRRIDQRTTFEFVIRDDTGSASYPQGEPVTITDSTLGTIFKGFLNSVKKSNLYPNTTNLLDVICIDNKWKADKLQAKRDYTNQFAGDIATDIVANYLGPEGVNATYAIRRDSTASQFGLGTLTNVIGTNNVDDGDLELALAGSPVSIAEQTTANFSTGTLTNVVATNNTLQPAPLPALKITADMTQPGLTTAYTYVKVWSGSLTVGASNFLIYDLFIDPSSPEAKISVDLTFSDGTTLRDTFVYTDQQSIAPGPSADLGGLASSSWFNRLFFLANYSGKTISYVSIGVGGTKAGTYTGYVKNLFYANSDRSVNTYFFNNTLNVNPPQPLQSSGYANTTVSVVNVYDIYSATSSQLYGAKSARITAATSLDAVKILKSSLVSWQVDTPAKTSFILKYSFDNLAFLPCTNNAPISVPPGFPLAGKSIYFSMLFFADPGASPEICPVLHSWQASFNPSYNNTKTDLLYSLTAPSDWTATGTTLTDVVVNSFDLRLNGVARNWDDSNYDNQPLFSTSGSEINNNTNFSISVGASTDARSQMVFAGQYQNFTAEVDIKIDSVSYGLVYRTTGWQNANNTFAYAAMVSTSQVQLGRGTNTGSGGGSFTSIATATISLTAGNWHRMKIIISGSNHKVYLDDILYINATDSTYSAAGYLALRVNNTTGGGVTALFDNFGVASNLTGTWTSAVYSLASVSHYGASFISWRDVSLSYLGGASTSVQIAYTIDGGTTWHNCTNGSAFTTYAPGDNIASVNIQFRITLSTSTASAIAAVDNLFWCILGQTNASGTRISPALSLGGVGRAGSTLVSWNGNAPTNTTLFIDTSPDSSTWTNIGSGASGSASIPGITSQAAAIDDTFSNDSSASYLNTSQAGGSAATTTWDTANSRLVLSGGSHGILLYNTTLTVPDFDMMLDMDESDAGGFVWRYQDSSNFYDLSVGDASSSTPNLITVYKVIAGTRTSIGTLAITFTRGTYHRLHVITAGSVIQVTFDETAITTITDSGLLSSGKCGIRNDGGTSRYYQLRIQPFGSSLAGQFLYTRARLASTDPTVTPQLYDLTASVRNSDIGNGAFIPQTQFSVFGNSRKTIAQALDDLVKASNATSGPYWWDIASDGTFYFQQQSAQVSAWIVSPADVLAANVTTTQANDLYRDSQWITGATDVIQITETRQGDGNTQSWALSYPVEQVLSVTVNNAAATFGVQNVATGKDFYYTVGNNTVSSSATLNTLQTVTFTYNGQVNILVNVPYQPQITILQAIQGGSGLVEMTEDAPGLNKTAALQLGQARNLQYAVLATTIQFTTNRDGLDRGQLVTIFLPQHKISDKTFLITDIETTWQQVNRNGVNSLLPFHQVTATDGPIIGDWTRYFTIGVKNG